MDVASTLRYTYCSSHKTHFCLDYKEPSLATMPVPTQSLVFLDNILIALLDGFVVSVFLLLEVCVSIVPLKSPKLNPWASRGIFTFHRRLSKSKAKVKKNLTCRVRKGTLVIK